MHKDRYTKVQLERMDIARELMANRYLLNSVIASLYRIQLQFDHNFQLLVDIMKKKGWIEKEQKKESTKERIKRKRLPKEKVLTTEGQVEFEKFSLTGSQYRALIAEYGVDIVTEACILMDGYLRRTLKRPKDTYRKLKDWAIHLAMKNRLNDIRKDIEVISTEIDPDTIEDRETAMKYVANVPSHIRNVDPVVKALTEKFNLSPEPQEEIFIDDEVELGEEDDNADSD